jgi:MFS family permease
MASRKMTGRDKITLLLLVLMSVFLFADQRIMAAILGDLSREYGITKATLGFIGSAFTVIGAFTSIFFGFYTDRFNRKKLLIAVVLIGEIPCLLTGISFFTQSLEMFVVLRVLTGIGIGGIYPISFSLLSDYFHEDHRATASAWLGVAWAVGAMAGQAAAGYLTNTWGWRIAFILAAAPNFPIAAIFALYAREPERGRTENALEDLIAQGLAYKQKIALSDFKLIFSNRTNLWTFLQGIPGTIPWGILGFFMIDYYETVGLTKEFATTVFLALGAGVLVGSVVFAIIGERLYRKIRDTCRYYAERVFWREWFRLGNV